MIEKMKDSGIEWLGEIPEEWKISKLKYVADFINGDRGSNYPSGDDMVDEGIIFVTSNNIHNTILDSRAEISKYITEEKYNSLGGAKIEINDIIFCLRGSIGLCAINKSIKAGTIASSLVDIKPHKVNADFLNYLLHAETSSYQTSLFMNGSCAANLSAENVANYYYISPSLSEQQAISDFLDKKVGQVDDILAELNKQVEILNQYRDSVIYEATSKGLNKNNVYQNIDNEWYPQIPAHWRFMAVKRLTSVLTCGVASTPEYVDENNGVLFLSAQNIQNNKLDLSIKKYIPISLHKTLTKNRKPEKGDILQVRVGATIGKCAIVDIDEEFSVYVSLSHIRVNHNMHNRFLNYIIGTDMFKEMVSLDIDYAGTQGNLNVADLREVRIPVPPIQEQEAIADYLDKKCTQIDKLITDKQKQIEKMENYKKSLIYEYVTGKKRVGV